MNNPRIFWSIRNVLTEVDGFRSALCASSESVMLSFMPISLELERMQASLQSWAEEVKALPFKVHEMSRVSCVQTPDKFEEAMLQSLSDLKYRLFTIKITTIARYGCGDDSCVQGSLQDLQECNAFLADRMDRMHAWLCMMAGENLRPKRSEEEIADEHAMLQRLDAAKANRRMFERAFALCWTRSQIPPIRYVRFPRHTIEPGEPIRSPYQQ